MMSTTKAVYHREKTLKITMLQNRLDIPDSPSTVFLRFSNISSNK